MKKVFFFVLFIFLGWMVFGQTININPINNDQNLSQEKKKTPFDILAIILADIINTVERALHRTSRVRAWTLYILLTFEFLVIGYLILVGSLNRGSELVMRLVKMAVVVLIAQLIFDLSNDLIRIIVSTAGDVLGIDSIMVSKMLADPSILVEESFKITTPIYLAFTRNIGRLGMFSKIVVIILAGLVVVIFIAVILILLVQLLIAQFSFMVISIFAGILIPFMLFTLTKDIGQRAAQAAVGEAIRVAVITVSAMIIYAIISTQVRRLSVNIEKGLELPEVLTYILQFIVTGVLLLMLAYIGVQKISAALTNLGMMGLGDFMRAASHISTVMGAGGRAGKSIGRGAVKMAQGASQVSGAAMEARRDTKGELTPFQRAKVIGGSVANQATQAAKRYLKAPMTTLHQSYQKGKQMEQRRLAGKQEEFARLGQKNAMRILRRTKDPVLKEQFSL